MKARLIVELWRKAFRQTVGKVLMTFVFLLNCFFASSQDKELKIVSRKPLVKGSGTLLGVSKNNSPVTFETLGDVNSPIYKLQIDGSTFALPALTEIEYADKAERIVVLGDSVHNHLALDVYANIYSAKGALIKSLGWVATHPSVTELTDEGYFFVAGNKNKSGAPPKMVFTCFDPNGNKQWELQLPDVMPASIYTAPNNKYIALVLYDPEAMKGSIQYHDASGKLLFTDNNLSAVSGIEFLPSGKVVVTVGTVWYLYNLEPEYKILAYGNLMGYTVGEYPISAHPNKDIFYIVSDTDSKSDAGCYLRAFNGNNGSLISEVKLEGKALGTNSRTIQVSENDEIKLLLNDEIIELGINK